ncbi:LysR family transcriptional regulator [Bordetella genomosp. 9]|uniref:LysR family transcriptional regulator n=1 Tax=Bordetella genomosp. 9 TaxID=1416803 RepID=A0A1W6YVT7_9BORD|nr:LysR family transcriptional regulator [Bordetella genomosp. 9]ARP89101.1 LysR family transcriptional regulator [Bordetella genomosp. 9]
MDRFQAMQVFVRVVDANSFTRAADHLGLPRTTVTTIIQNLEKLLNVRLLNRTTRRLSLTPDGAAYYERCVRILADVEEAEAAFMDASRRPRGKLRIDTPAAIGRLILIPSLCEFHQRYPDIELVIGMGDRPVDLVQEAVDCVIRVGELKDSSMVARRIGMFEGITCAAPSYIAAHGEPQTLDDLADHHAVHYFSSRTGRVIDWDFMVDGQAVEVKMRGVVSVNDADAYMACGLQGFGLIQPPRYMALPYLQSGALKEILPAWKPKPMPISVVYPHNRHLSPKVRAFTDWAAEIFSRCPLLSGRGDMVDSECTWAGQDPVHTYMAPRETAARTAPASAPAPQPQSAPAAVVAAAAAGTSPRRGAGVTPT